MSISDTMMWRYYELLTDVQVPDIQKMKLDMHPMKAKKDLARIIVRDFHSQEAAEKAAEDWGEQFQKGATPVSLDEVGVSLAQVKIAHADRDQREGGAVQAVNTKVCDDAEVVRVDKLLRQSGLAASTTEAGRKIKERAVHINGCLIEGLAVLTCLQEPLTVRVGKQMKRVVLTRP
jgi:tyrosyl-tRNA synthetase